MAKYELLNFSTNTKIYNQAGKIEQNKDDIGYHFVNTGSVICYVNSLPLYPSGVLDTMYAGYKDNSLYTIKFDTAAGTNTELLVLTYTQQ
jgi:hypothetical protein